jgi:hypothetical protein
LKIKYIFVTLVINIFAMMFVTLFQEFADIRDTYGTICQTFDTSLDSAVVLTTASEEFFTEQYISVMSSDADAKNNIRYMRRGKWIDANLYILAMYEAENNALPPTQQAYNTYASSNDDITKIYNFLFGVGGTDVYEAELDWANFYRDPSVTPPAVGSLYNTREPNADFKSFYDNVGKDITSNLFVRERDGETWVMKEKELPVLTQMGLRLDTVNEKISTITADNFVSVEHYGKLAGGADSTYYLTPYSLGVTYVPPQVLKTAMRVNLENTLRLSKCKISPTAPGFTDFNTIYASAEGCIDTSVYADDGTGNANVNPETHERALRNNDWGIFNDGNVEYDMNTLEVKVDYYTVDFYDDANWEIVNKIEGATPYDSSLLSSLPSRLKDLDTSDGAIDGKRIVAVVSARVKLEVPYKSPILQWFVENTSTSSDEHYGVGSWDSTTSSIDQTESGNWYTYTTFISVSR